MSLADCRNVMIALLHSVCAILYCVSDEIAQNPWIGEYRLVVADQPVEFEKLPIEVQGFRKSSDLFRGIQRTYLKFIKENRKMSTCWTWKTLGFPPIMPKILPGHCSKLLGLTCISTVVLINCWFCCMKILIVLSISLLNRISRALCDSVWLPSIVGGLRISQIPSQWVYYYVILLRNLSTPHLGFFTIIVV